MIQQLGGEFGDVNNSGWCYWRPWHVFSLAWSALLRVGHITRTRYIINQHLSNLSRRAVTVVGESAELYHEEW